MIQMRRVSDYVLAWGLWALSSALGVFIGFWAVLDTMKTIAETATMDALLRGTSAEQFQVPFIRNVVDRFGTLAIGVLSVLLVVFVEHYYRTGVDEGALWRRFVLVTAIEFGVLFVALTIQSILFGALGLFTIWSVVVPVVVLAVTAALSWVLTRMPKNSSSA
ncbi:MAG: hypothetical protein ACP5HG_14620 [Anaerolineae bacterium]